MKSPRSCKNCHKPLPSVADYCPHCGSLNAEGRKCVKHPRTDATGVCIICSLPYCGKCATRVNKLFLCARHDEYEIFEGMARVYGVSDTANAQFVVRCLKQAGFHPFLFSRKASPISIGGPDYTLFRASGEYNGHIINEEKVMVPCAEVIEAEKVLKTLSVKSKKSPTK